ncbi:MAG TPA: hypothetical protein VEW93_07830 [Acidimicrobiales bacterium]|nr:hypothetical protein [Acidimicrobiales bacterium]
MTMTQKLIIDGLLVVGFGVQHSILASLRVKRVVKAKTRMEALAWRSVESLTNAVYILAAAALWQRTGDVVWAFSGTAMVAVGAVAVVSWLWYWQLHLFEADCGLAFGATTLVAHIARTEQPKSVPWAVGSRRWIRFPVHTAFFGMFFFLPTMTADLLVLAIMANLYNIIGSILYDNRLKTLAGESYMRYVNVTGLMFPPVYRAPRGAKGMDMPGPHHWRRPLVHTSGVVAGLGIGLLYLAIIGPRATSGRDMLVAGLTAVLAAVLVGVVLGNLRKPDRTVDWHQQQTDLATTISLASALGVVSWAGFGWISSGQAPYFAAFLPLWFMVQYLGHVIAFLAARQKWSADVVPLEVPADAPAREPALVGLAEPAAARGSLSAS